MNTLRTFADYERMLQDLRLEVLGYEWLAYPDDNGEPFAVDCEDPDKKSGHVPPWGKVSADLRSVRWRLRLMHEPTGIEHTFTFERGLGLVFGLDAEAFVEKASKVLTPDHMTPQDLFLKDLRRLYRALISKRETLTIHLSALMCQLLQRWEPEPPALPDVLHILAMEATIFAEHTLDEFAEAYMPGELPSKVLQAYDDLQRTWRFFERAGLDWQALAEHYEWPERATNDVVEVEQSDG